VFGKILHFPVLRIHYGQFSLSLGKGGGDRLPYALFVFVLGLQFVYDEFYEMRFVAVQRLDFFQQDYLAVYPALVEAFFAK